jgi:hypothetical protein
MGARQAKSIAIARRGHPTLPTAGRGQELSPRGCRVGDDRRGRGRNLEMGEDVALGAGVRGVVTDHEHVERRGRRELACPRPVVDRNPDGSRFPLLLESNELREGGVGQRRAEPLERPLEAAAHVSREVTHRRSGRNDQALPVAPESLAKSLRQVARSHRSPEKVLDPTLEC